MMKNPVKSKYLYSMLAGFGAISLSVTFFFVLYRFQSLRGILSNIMDILSPFVYGGVMAYLLRPACNWYEDTLTNAFGGKFRKLAPSLAVTLSMITGVLVVYTLIIMIGPELIKSIRNIWESMPDKVERYMNWLSVTFGENEALMSFLENSYQSCTLKLRVGSATPCCPRLPVWSVLFPALARVW